MFIISLLICICICKLACFHKNEIGHLNDVYLNYYVMKFNSKWDFATAIEKQHFVAKETCDAVEVVVLFGICSKS